MPKNLDGLQGEWHVTALQMDGQPMPAEMLGEARVIVTGNRFTSLGMGVEYAGTLRVDASADPAQIDMQFDQGPPQGTTNLGIYRLDGETWHLCLATHGTVRPASFQSIEGTGIAVQTLVRGGGPKAATPKAKAEVAPAAGPATEFEGEWPLVSAVMDGKPMDQSLIQWVKRVTHGNQTTVMAGPQTMLKVEFTFDASQSPASIDYLNLAAPNKGKRQLGIYKLEGGLLTFCVAPPDAPRPAEFSSVKGDGRTLTVWKKK